MKARTTIVELLKAEPEWRAFFKQCCEAGSLRLRSQVSQWHDELAYRGYDCPSADVEDALIDLAHKIFPESPAVRWDTEHASRLCKDALARLGEYYAGLREEERNRLDLSGQEIHEAAMLASGEENDPAAFRAALCEWERAGMEALERACERHGAA